jgi:hypothetical protein
VRCVYETKHLWGGGGRDGNPFCSGLILMSWPRGGGVRCEPEQIGLKFRISREQLTHVQDEI